MAVTLSVVFFDLGETLVTSPRKFLPGAKSLLNALQLKGFRLGIISNTPGLTSRSAILALLPTNFDLAVFDPALVLFSSEVGVEKPKKLIFEKAVTKAGVAANKCLFCTEDAVDALVAQAAGMRSLRIITGSTDLAKLESYLAAYHLNS